jgi:hypothetical protein
MRARSTERSPRAARAAAGVVAAALALLSCAQTTVARPVSRVPEPSGNCLEARRDWAEAAVAAREPLDGLAECLAGGVPPCATDMAAVRSALAELTTHERRIQALCGELP